MRGTPFANPPDMTPTIRKILLPTDFGPSSTSAAAYAGALARALGASVHLVHVLEDPLIKRGGWHSAPLDSPDQLYHECRAKLAALAATLRRPADRITIEVRTGRAAEAITDAAVDYGADLIVMSTPGRSGLPHLVRECVADRVIRAARCPVLAVRQSGAARVHAGTRAA